MKKALLCLLTVILAIPTFGQLQIESGGKAKTATAYKKEASYIRWVEDGYYFRACDYECSKYRLQGEKYIVMLYLGRNQDEVQQSATALKNWFSSASNDDFIYVTNPNEQKVCLYKFNANMYLSYGTEVNCKATRLNFGVDMTNALLNGSYTSKAKRDELMANIEFGEHILTGMCSFKKDFLKSIKNFKDDENAIYGEVVANKEDTMTEIDTMVVSTDTIATKADTIVE